MPANALLTGDTDSALAPQPTWADAWDYNKGAISDYIAQQRALAVQQGLWDPDTNRPTQAGLIAAAHGYGNALLMGTTAPGIKAYHGSPYSFDAFDASKIGTGEGAQAYGHGLYFAEHEPIAQGYRDRLTQASPYVVTGNLSPEAQGVLRQYQEAGSGTGITRGNPRLTGSYDDLRHFIESRYDPATDADIKGANDLYDAMQNGRIKPATGSMYEVNIGADPQHFLDWDKPLSEQSQHVLDALEKAGYPTTQVFSYAGKRSFPTQEGAEVIARSQKLPNYTIEQSSDGGYKIVTPRTGTGSDIVASTKDPAATSAMLRDAGIAGIRYLDAGSRGAGQGTSNYVVFDPQTIEILRKYGIAGLGLGLGAAATQGADQQQ